MSKLISDKDFFNFDWPPKFITRPKQKKKYSHSVSVVYKSDTDTCYVFTFKGEKKAKSTRDLLREATNVAGAEYERKEVPIFNDLGLIEQ